MNADAPIIIVVAVAFFLIGVLSRPFNHHHARIERLTMTLLETLNTMAASLATISETIKELQAQDVITPAEKAKIEEIAVEMTSLAESLTPAAPEPTPAPTPSPVPSTPPATA